MAATPPSAPTTRRAFLRRGAGAALLLGAGPVLAGCGDGSGSAAGAGGTDVAVSLPAGGNALSIWKPIAERRHLSAPGVRLKWVGGDPGQLQTQFLSGSVDISTFGPLGTALALLGGDSIAIVGPGIYAHQKWIVPDASPARSAADLRGKRVATGLNTGEFFRATQLVAAMAGGHADTDYHWVHTQGAAAVALFERGDVDAIYIGEPNASILVAQGARQVDSLQARWKAASGSDELLFNAGPTIRTGWARDRPAAARGSVRVLSQASTYLAAHGDELSAVATAIGVKPDQRDVAAQLPRRMAGVYMPGFGRRQRAQLEQVVALGVKHGVLERAPEARVSTTLPAA